MIKIMFMEYILIEFDGLEFFGDAIMLVIVRSKKINHIENDIKFSGYDKDKKL